LTAVTLFLRAMLTAKIHLAVENLALRQQLAVCRQSVKRPKLRPRDRVFWVLLSRLWPSWRSALAIVQPETVVKWHRVFVVLRHDRREIVHFNVTVNSYAEWTAQQIIDTFPYEEAPRFLIRDRDGIYGNYFNNRIESMGIEEVPTAPRSPGQNPYCKRAIGSIGRECLDHVIVLGERHLHRVLTEYLDYYHNSRCHLSLDRNSPTPRDVEPPSLGEVVSIPQVGGLHHRYTRRAA